MDREDAGGIGATRGILFGLGLGAASWVIIGLAVVGVAAVLRVL